MAQMPSLAFPHCHWIYVMILVPLTTIVRIKKSHNKVEKSLLQQQETEPHAEIHLDRNYENVDTLSLTLHL